MKTRLTLWFALSFALLIAAGTAGFYFILHHQLLADLDRQLVRELAVYQEAVALAGNEEELAQLTETFLSGPQADSLREAGYIFVLETSGGLLMSNAGDLGLEHTEVAESARAKRQPLIGQVEAERETQVVSLRVLATPVLLESDQIGIVILAASQQGLMSAMRLFLLLLVSGGIAACLVAATAAWWLVGKALEPVSKITRTAATISRRDLSRRIDYKGPRDEIGELASTMNTMLDRLESAFVAQDRFISDVSHELRTPLTIIKGHLQVVDRQKSLDPDFVRREHALVLDEIDRMNRLVNDLLTLSRATRTDFLRLESIELDSFLSALVAEGPHLGDREWTLDCVPGGFIVADQDRLTQVFLNLMTNALKHTRPGQVIALGGKWIESGEQSKHRELRTGDQASREPRTALLWVRDEGEGMTEEVLGHVFDRFFRGPAAVRQSETETKIGADGLGLGLAIVKAVVEAHGGKVTVESRPGHGARFNIYLPATADSTL